ncbi:MAG: hypothetical protein HYX68_07510 [Planctomycetes bacterium]|nr:hypothetical protein [Planctomycetota bacterium]
MPGWQGQPPRPAPTPWQAPARPTFTARGVSGAPAPARFVMPSPEALGVTAPKQAAPDGQIDWRAIQARVEKLRVIRYKKQVLSEGVCVTLFLPTADPKLAQPVQARASSEGAAVLLALQAAETWTANAGR